MIEQIMNYFSTNVRIYPDFRNTNYMSSMRDEVTIESGTQEKTFQLTLLDDQIVRDETVYVRLVFRCGIFFVNKRLGKI